MSNMRKSKSFRQRFRDFFHRSRALQFIWHFFVFSYSLLFIFYSAVKFKESAINLINFIEILMKNHSFTEWIKLLVTAAPILVVFSSVLLAGDYSRKRLLEILKDEFSHKGKNRSDEQ